ncbi:phage head-tail connector protein [Virgibacillus halodenitrificans]|nr:phage head-tail connector protein [Virgibacillus halodenitrificans]
MALKETIAKMAEIDEKKHSDYLDIMLPLLLEFAEEKCNNQFDESNPPSGVKLFLSETIAYKLDGKRKGIKSRSMGSVSYSYDTDLPDKVIKHLKPYKKVRTV